MKFIKYYILLLVISVAMVVTVAPACNSSRYADFSYKKDVAHCAMASLSKSPDHHLFYLKQLFTAWPGQSELLQLLSLIIIISIASSFYQITKSARFNYWRAQYFYNMKPWDQLRLALAQGLIHNKHLD